MTEKEGSIQKRAAAVLSKIAAYKEKKAEETRKKFASSEIRKAEDSFRKYVIIKRLAELSKTSELKEDKKEGTVRLVSNKDYFVDPLLYDYRPFFVSFKQANLEDRIAKLIAWAGFEDLVGRNL
jgi:hypothetical protein